jgi:RNA polymerase sigma-70 factor (ECF subfamily)
MNPSQPQETYLSDSNGGRRLPEATAARVTDQGADRELLRRMAAGDESALGTLYDRWVTLVHSLVLQILRDRDEAEEVVEETFWQAWRQADRYMEARGAVSTWLTTIARSRALDRLRALNRLREDSLSTLTTDEGESALPAGISTDDPLAGALSAEVRTKVAAALTTLPVEQREALEMAYFGGLSQTEIAERTGIALGTVKTRTRLAMEKLREQLGVLRDTERR